MKNQDISKKDNTIIEQDSDNITNKRIDIKEENMRKLSLLIILYEKELKETYPNGSDRDNFSFIVNLAIENFYKNEETIKRFQNI